MDVASIVNRLKKREFSPIYLLFGDEPYYIDMVSDWIENNVLSEEEKAFNQTVFYGGDTSVNNVWNLAQRYPMMADYHVVIVKEAQNLKDIDKLAKYAERPLDSTILVLNYKHKPPDKRKKFYLAISKCGVVFESKKIFENQVPPWINKYLEIKGYKAMPDAARLLSDYLGNDLGKVANELDKLMITLKQGEKTITTVHIEQNIGISKDYNFFELQNALIAKDILKANRIVDYFDKNPKNNPLVLTITMLYNFFWKVLLSYGNENLPKYQLASLVKVSSYFEEDFRKAPRVYPPKKVVAIFSFLRDYDLKSKGVGNVSANDGDLLKELIFKILHI